MPSYFVKITQVYRNDREIIISVVADDAESALELVKSGDVETPEFDDRRWRDGWDLQEQTETLV